MSSFIDNEFGEVVIRKSKLSRSVRLSIAPNGILRVSMPPFATLFAAKRLINSSRKEIRDMLQQSDRTSFTDGMHVGKSHSIHTRVASTLQIKHVQQIIDVALPADKHMEDRDVQAQLRTAVIKALRKEAKAYLPKRLAYFANKYEYSYEKVQFSHASSRWGSCSSSGTISLNIALMKLDFDIIDYVLLHELAHTVEMNHSDMFWELLANTFPQYKIIRKKLKQESPTI